MKDTTVNVSPLPVPAMDWALFLYALPLVLLGTAWAVWVLFLLLPALFGFHDAVLFAPIENGLFVLMGLVLCLSATVALSVGEWCHSLLFVLSVSLLAYWF